MNRFFAKELDKSYDRKNGFRKPDNPSAYDYLIRDITLPLEFCGYSLSVVGFRMQTASSYYFYIIPPRS